jgi:hypothetical protein
LKQTKYCGVVYPTVIYYLYILAKVAHSVQQPNYGLENGVIVFVSPVGTIDVSPLQNVQNGLGGTPLFYSVVTWGALLYLK